MTKALGSHPSKTMMSTVGERWLVGASLGRAPYTRRSRGKVVAIGEKRGGDPASLRSLGWAETGSERITHLMAIGKWKGTCG